MTETIPAGLLPEISKGMNISLASAGQRVTVYAPSGHYLPLFR